MARPSPSPDARLTVLRRARLKAAKVRSGETLSALPMAAMLEVRWPTLREWCNTFEGFAESGAFQVGGNGIDYEFRPRQTITWLIKHFEAKQREGQAKARRLDRLTGMTGEPEPEEQLTLDEQAKALRNQSMVRDAQIRDRELVRIEEVQERLRRVFPSMLHAGLSAAQQLDPNGEWTAAQREFAETVARHVLTAQEKVIRTEFPQFSEATAQPIEAHP